MSTSFIFCMFQLQGLPKNTGVDMATCGGDRRLFLAIIVISGTLLVSFWSRITYGVYKQSTFNRTISGNNVTMAVGYNTGPKIILAWNSFYKSRDYGQGFGQAPFEKCPVSNCDFTNNKTYFPNASAVVFHSKFITSTPIRKHPGQLYVFFLRESPRYSHPRSNQFNLTMTYRRDSDIPIPVSEIFRKPIPDVRYDIKHPFANRTRNVAWVVSHCRTSSKRERYARELKRHIDVDIYGDCGKKGYCPKGDKNCFMERIPSTYKFYLGFENSICQDYVTEKLFRTLSSEIVPIVFGGTNYSRDAPPNSVINVEDYSSPEELARYLRRLASNETEYNSYFEWKKSYDILLTTMNRGFCKLCEIVNTPSFHKTYPSVQSWWVTGKCRDPRTKME